MIYCCGYRDMTIILKTEVAGNYLDIMQKFDRELFEALKPPVGMSIREFTGSQKGDKVVLDFTFPAKFTWQSDIIEHGQNKEKAWFVDIGSVLPWPLKSWRHEHIVERIDDHSSCIIDHMTYSCSNAAITMAVKPFLFAAFYPRKRIYKQYFSENSVN